jgi:plastocyanin
VRPIVAAGVFLCAAALAVPASAGEDATAASKAIAVHDNYFKPRSTSVGGPTFVTWKWRGHRKHNVYFTQAPKHAKPKNCGTRKTGSCTRKLRKAGTYRYVCTIHGSMTAKIRVK